MIHGEVDEPVIAIMVYAISVAVSCYAVQISYTVKINQ